MSSFNNKAAYIPGKAENIKVDDAPTGKPGPGQLLIKNGAVAVNPVDWKMQEYGLFVKSWPTILGCDLAGEVVQVSDSGDLNGIQQGDRVLAYPMGLASGKTSESAFQLYTVVNASGAVKLPDEMSFEEACVLPLSVATAAHGLYAKEFLALPFPSHHPEKTGKTLLLWGASSSVGASVVQFAVASGVDVVATASKRNHDFVKKLGARVVLDHSRPGIVGDLVAELQKGEVVGAYDAIGSRDTSMNTAQVLAQLGGGFMADVLEPPKDLPATVNVGRIFAPNVFLAEPEIGRAIYTDFLPGALASGQFKPLPPPQVVGTGLEAVQEGFAQNKAGVSAAKVVIKL